MELVFFFYFSWVDLADGEDGWGKSVKTASGNLENGRRVEFFPFCEAMCAKGEEDGKEEGEKVAKTVFSSTWPSGEPNSQLCSLSLSPSPGGGI